MKLSITTISLTLGLSGCCVPWHGPPIATTQSGLRLCAKHRVLLVTSNGFRIPTTEPKTCIDPNIKELKRIEACYPDAVPWFESLTGSGDPTRITYCPLCERGAQRICK